MGKLLSVVQMSDMRMRRRGSRQGGLYGRWSNRLTHVTSEASCIMHHSSLRPNVGRFSVGSCGMSRRRRRCRSMRLIYCTTMEISIRVAFHTIHAVLPQIPSYLSTDACKASRPRLYRDPSDIVPLWPNKSFLGTQHLDGIHRWPTSVHSGHVIGAG